MNAITNKEEQSHVKHSTLKQNAYCVASSDRPRLIITEVQLKDNSYDEWAKAMRLAFRLKKKLGFSDGFIPKHEDGPEKEEE